VRIGKPVVIAVTLMVMTFVLAACGGGATPTDTGCFDAVDGAISSVPCDSGNTDVQPGSTPDDGPLPTNTPSNGGTGPAGLQVFLREASPPCATCHAIDNEPFAIGQVGPNLTHIGSKDAGYIRGSIIDPNADIAAECPAGACTAGVMPQNYSDTLTSEQLDSLVEYLASLK
jgi:hypothetical protein